MPKVAQKVGRPNSATKEFNDKIEFLRVISF
jgi:hypothetical protein